MNSKSESETVEPAGQTPIPVSKSKKPWVILAVVLAFIFLSYLSQSLLGLDFLAEQEARLNEYYSDHPVVTLFLAFVIYVVVTGLSIPGATVLSLLFAWFFGFGVGLLLVSFASTTGATLAFLLSRYLFRDWIQQKFGDRLRIINMAIEQEGVFYLFLMRLIPAFPFFVVNAVMGLTKIKATTFWWVSQFGMLAGTTVFVYAGSLIPDLATLKDDGIKAVFTGPQLLQISFALALLGLFPIVAKKLVERFRKTPLGKPSVR